MDATRVRRDDSPKRPYETPTVRSERMFETNALSCGKCTSGALPQYQCGTMLQNS